MKYLIDPPRNEMPLQNVPLPHGRISSASASASDCHLTYCDGGHGAIARIPFERIFPWVGFWRVREILGLCRWLEGLMRGLVQWRIVRILLFSTVDRHKQWTSQSFYEYGTYGHDCNTHHGLRKKQRINRLDSLTYSLLIRFHLHSHEEENEPKRIEAISPLNPSAPVDTSFCQVAIWKIQPCAWTHPGKISHRQNHTSTLLMLIVVMLHLEHFRLEIRVSWSFSWIQGWGGLPPILQFSGRQNNGLPV